MRMRLWVVMVRKKAIFEMVGPAKASAGQRERKHGRGDEGKGAEAKESGRTLLTLVDPLDHLLHLGRRHRSVLKDGALRHITREDAVVAEKKRRAAKIGEGQHIVASPEEGREEEERRRTFEHGWTHESVDASDT